MAVRIKRKKRKIGIKTMPELVDFFNLLGLSVVIDDRGSGYKTLQVVSKSGAVAVCEGWERFDHAERLQFTFKRGRSSVRRVSGIVKSIVESISTKRYLSWEDSSDTRIPFGRATTKVKKRIDLPDFSSVSELRILMAAEGV